MPSYLMGIDLGTSSVRAGIFSREGVIISISSRTYPIDAPSPEIAEQNPETWWQCTCEAIKESILKSGLKGTDIAGISFSGQMHGTVMLDRNGVPVHPAIIWADSRSAGVTDEISRIVGETRINQQLLNRIFPGNQASTLFYIRNNDKKLWNSIRHVLLPKDYIRFRMSGYFHTEPSDASAAMLFDQDKREWSEDILKDLHIPLDFMPFVIGSSAAAIETSDIEELTGLPDGIPLITGGSDQAAAALGNGILTEGQMFAAIGTGAQLVTPVSKPLASPGLCLNTFCHLPENMWYFMGATLAGGLCLRWFRDNFCPETSFETLTEEAASVIPRVDDPVFTPYLNGKRSPDMAPGATGIFHGIRLAHSRPHFIRAIMEGVVFELLESYLVMKKAGITPKTVTTSGGFTKSPVWLNIMADSFGIAVEVSGAVEQSCFGAALLAGIGAKFYGSYKEAAEKLPPPLKTIEPDSEMAELYNERFRKYRDVFEKSNPV